MRRKPADVFGVERPLVAMVHLPPLPGSPGWTGGAMRDVLQRATEEARTLRDAGFDGLLVENYGDVPFHAERVPPETVAAMTLAVRAVVEAAGLPTGVNVLRNDTAAALAIAAVTGASFIRVNVHTGAMLTDQGWIAGRAHETLRERARLGAAVEILADVLVKHASPPPGLAPADAARDAWSRGLADGLIVSGPATGAVVDLDRIARIRGAVPDAPLWLGSGLSPANLRHLLPLADGAIVGSALRMDGVAGRPLDPDRVRALIEAARAAR